MPSEKRADQTVPIVIYKGGERIVIGSAYLKGDGSIEGKVFKDVKEDLKDLIFGGRIGNFSFNPKVEPKLSVEITDADISSVSVVYKERESP